MPSRPCCWSYLPCQEWCVLLLLLLRLHKASLLSVTAALLWACLSLLFLQMAAFFCHLPVSSLLEKLYCVPPSSLKTSTAVCVSCLMLPATPLPVPLCSYPSLPIIPRCSVRLICLQQIHCQGDWPLRGTAEGNGVYSGHACTALRNWVLTFGVVA